MHASSGGLRVTVCHHSVDVECAKNKKCIQQFISAAPSSRDLTILFPQDFFLQHDLLQLAMFNTTKDIYFCWTMR